MLHKIEKIGQIRRRHPPLVEGQYELPGFRIQQVVAVFDPFRDSLARQYLANVVLGDESLQVFV